MASTGPAASTAAETRAVPSNAADIEVAKRNAAKKAVAEHFSPSHTHIGIGSGSTVVYVVDAIKAIEDTRIKDISFVPTGYQSRQVILKAGLKDLNFDSLPEETLLDVAFDGADEVDEDLNCIKGGGACLYQEKLVATRAKKFICVADHRKLQARLLTKWPSIPIEVEPLAAPSVIAKLRALGSSQPQVRQTQGEKAGSLRTDQDNFIVDAPFPTLQLPHEIEKSNPLHGMHKSMEGKGEGWIWEVATLAERIKSMVGVLEVGLFCGVNGPQAMQTRSKDGGQKPCAAYFGMSDGGVVKRVAEEGMSSRSRVVEIND